MKKWPIVLTSVLMLGIAGLAHAVPLQKGTSLLAIQLTEGTADFVDGDGSAGYLGAYDHSEIGIQVQCWKFLTNDYAFNVSGGFGFFGEKDEPGAAAAINSVDAEYSQSSWQVRVGGDRFGHINDRFSVYAGPGIQIWGGQSTLNKDTAAEVKTASVLRVSLTGRIGAIMRLNDRLSLSGQFGHHLGHASAEGKGAKSTWWPSGGDGAGGVVFSF